MSDSVYLSAAERLCGLSNDLLDIKRRQLGLMHREYSRTDGSMAQDARAERLFGEERERLAKELAEKKNEIEVLLRQIN